MNDRQFGVFSIVSWVPLEANQKGIRALAECVLASLEGGRPHIFVKQSTVGLPFLPISHRRKCPSKPKTAGSQDRCQPTSDPGIKGLTDQPSGFGASDSKILLPLATARKNRPTR